MRYRDIFKNGVIEENPTFVQLLGMCPTLAVTTSVSNSIGMGLSATFVLMCSNFVISLVRKVIPNKIRIAAYIVIIATFVSIIEMLLKAYLPELSESLGMFVPLIVVNCIILARAESFAAKNAPLPSALDGISMGLGFTGALTIIGAVRELLGNGTILGFSIFGASYNPALIFILPPGAFLVLGVIIAVINMISDKKNTKEAGK